MNQYSQLVDICPCPKHSWSLDRRDSVGWASSHKAKGPWFDPLSVLMSGLWVWFLVGACRRGKGWMFLSHISVSLPLFLPFLSLKISKILKKNILGNIWFIPNVLEVWSCPKSRCIFGPW